MKDIVLITGRGMISNKLALLLSKEGYSVRFLSRTKAKDTFIWDINSKYIQEGAFDGVKHIIHLAGENISTGRWTKKKRNRIIESRVQSSQLIFEYLNQNNINLDNFISASAIGYYGTFNSNKILNEKDNVGKDFLAEVCYKWEQMANQFTQVAVNTNIVRIGVVFDKDDGAFSKIVAPIKKGLGAILGSGKQYIPWIHIEDLMQIFLFLIKNNFNNEIFNAVAPNFITNKELTKKIAFKLKKKLILPNIPKFALKIILGEMSSILLKGSRISSEKIIKVGYEFKYSAIEQLLDEL